MQRLSLRPLLLLCAALLLVSCGGGGGSASLDAGSSPRSGTVFVNVSDAPLPSVLAFSVTVNSLSLTGSGGSVDVLGGPSTVEFSRLLGLRTLLALNSVPEGTYNSATITLAGPVISYLDLSTNPASVGTINGSLTTTTLTIALNPPLVVSAGGLAGLHLDFRLRESLQLDGGGQITGVVDPHLRLRPLPPGAEEAFIDELRGGLTSVNVAGNSFVLQRRTGRAITVRVDGNTVFEGTTGLATMAPPAVVEVSGHVQADGSILASSVELLTTDSAFVGGVVLGVSGNPADSVTLLVREEIPDLADIQVGRPATIALDASTHFDIHHLELPIENLLFNRSSLVLGQRIAVGGAIDQGTIAARRVVLRRQGLDGEANPGSLVVVSGNRGHFDLVANGFFGYLFAAPLRVRTSEHTTFVNLNGLSAVGDFPGARLRVAGLLLRDPNTGNPVLVAGRVERLTD